MPFNKDFIVKNGAQISANVVIGAYATVNVAPQGGMIISGNVGIGTATIDSNVSVQIGGSTSAVRYYIDDSSSYPACSPSLYFNFINSISIDSRINFSRASVGSYTSASGLISKANINVPRFDYDASYIPPKPLGLLVEGASTNNLLYSESIGVGVGTSSWSYINPPLSATTGYSAPDGSTNGTLIVPPTTAGLYDVVQYFTTATNTNYVFSVYIKPTVSTTWILLQLVTTGTNSGFVEANFNIAGTGNVGIVDNSGTATSATGNIFYVGNGWYKTILSGIPSVGSPTTTTRCAVRNSTSNGGGGNVVGDGVSGYILWGAQLEITTIPIGTSYITTTSTTITRSTDIATIPVGLWYNPTQGTLLATIVSNLIAASSFNWSTLGFYGSPSNSNNLMDIFVGAGIIPVGRIINNLSTEAYLNTGTLVNNTSNKIGLVYSPNGFLKASNQSNANSATGNVIPTVSYLDIGTRNSGGIIPLTGHIQSISYWPLAFTSNQLSNTTGN